MLGLFYILIMHLMWRAPSRNHEQDKKNCWYFWLVDESKMKYVAEHALTLGIQRDHVFLTSLPWNSLELTYLEIHLCPPATVFVGIFSLFHSLCREDVPVLYSSSQKMSISGKAPVSRVVLSMTDQPTTMLKVSACLDLPFIFKGKL